jgi:hypothetical protein
MDDDTEDTIRYGEHGEENDSPSAAHTLQEDEAGSRGPGFDPTPYMRQLRGRGGAQEYLDVKWRLLWLRREHPDAEIITEHIKIDETSAIFKATVSVPSGGRATGYGSETAGDFGDFIEKAETKAIGRALNALGYGAQFAEGDEEPAPPAAIRPTMQSGPNDARPASSAAPIPIPSARKPAAVPPERPRATDTESPAVTPSHPDESDPLGIAPSSTVTPASPPSPLDDPEPDMADYSHAAFWDWARPRGYETREDVERTIGRSMKGLTPKEVHRLLRERGAAE